jgi:predicted PhzF superfamily epimerase YddE/YHI9
MKSRRSIQIDVFSPIPNQGSGLAVIADTEDLSDRPSQACRLIQTLSQWLYQIAV